MGGLFEKLEQTLDREQAIAVATVVGGPSYLGNKLLINPDHTTQGTLGHPDLDAKTVHDAEKAIWSGDASIYRYLLNPENNIQQTFDIFIEGFPPPPELIIVGAGHISIPLTIIAKTLQYRVVVIDARAAFATRERFPTADELIVAWPDEVLASRNLYPSTSIAILTHDPKFDEPTLKVALTRSTGYVGAIGSRKTSQERAQRLRDQGLTTEQIQRIHGPIGLDIGARAPAEIALSIMAEIVAVRHHLSR